MGKFKDLTGLVFGDLTVIERTLNSKSGRTRWVCKCKCGNIIIVQGNHLVNGATVSCGCHKRRLTTERNTTHNKSRTRLYRLHYNMIGRCYKEGNKSYKDYGGRGIKVCDEWLDKENGFMNFYNWAMNNGYDENAYIYACTLDRIDVNGNYEPSNCRWVDMKTQNNNRRTTYKLECNGKLQTLSEIARINNISHRKLHSKVIRGNYTLDKAIELLIEEKEKLGNSCMNKADRFYCILESLKNHKKLETDTDKLNSLDVIIEQVMSLEYYLDAGGS